jgi:hypothetical protein
MRRTLIHFLLSVSALSGPAAYAADDLTPLKPETLPMPAPVPVPVFAGPVSFYRPNRLDVWQYYGVDRTGRWVPRVILTGEGAFYLYNGMPYPGLAVNQLNVMPYLLD